MIREATHQDIPAVRQLMQAEPGFWQSDWSDATLARGIDSAADLALVWEEDGRLLGFACAHDLGFRAYLSELVVAPSARGRGIAERLLKQIETRLAQRGGRTLIADVWRNAEPFYRALGWEAPDVLLLRRRLDAASG